MKKSFLFKTLLVALMLLLPTIRSFAYDFEADNDEGTTIYYNITSADEKTVEVTYLYDNFKNGYKGVIVIPSSVRYKNTTYSVTGIGNSLFVNCSSLRSIEIPSSVTSIRESAFKGCTGLTSIEIPSSVTSTGRIAFQSCTSLTSIVIPSTSIGSSAFWNCTSLTSVEITSSVTSIGEGAFSGCRSLSHITSLNPEPPICSYHNEPFDGVDKTTCLLSVPIGFK
ncbi:MAG: leucine-rich repeat domain-containing protein [Prevotella sp.]|nr:leucine-rich repeat domain-containing protein [Prevotella sp.]